MRYKILRTDQGSERFGKDEVIYILPRGAAPDQYLVIYPAGLELELKKLLISGSYSIRTYKGLTSEAVGKVKEILVGKAERRLERLKSRGTNMFAAGTVIAVFGLLNWFIPDPLPMIDELILTFGGAAVALAGFARRRRGIEEFERRGEIVAEDIDGIEVQEDPFLSHCAAAIRERGTLSEPGVEEESRWLVKYTDIDALITAGTVTDLELVRFFRLVKKMIPLETLTRGTRRRRDGLIQRLQNQYGFSRDAMAVYTALFHSFREDFSI